MILESKDNTQISPEVAKLLDKYSQSREDLIKDLEVITALKSKMDLLLPTDINFRNKHILDEKLKILTSFFSSILSIRQEINKSIVSEIEIRRKLNPSKGGDTDFDETEIRSIAAKIEDIHSKNNNIEFPSDILDEPSALPDIENKNDNTKGTRNEWYW